MTKIIIKDSEISSSVGINISGNLSIAGDTTKRDLFGKVIGQALENTDGKAV